MESHYESVLSRLAAPALLIAADLAPPAAAQAPEEDIVVTGNYHRVPDNVDTLSQRVSYADLDLGTAWGREELRHRVKLTARYLCDTLGESDKSDALTPSCRDAATRDAMARIGTIEASWTVRGTAWARGPAWPAPYPDEWAAARSNDGG